MPIRDVVLTAFVFGMLPVCAMRPWIGFLMWAWIGYMNPHRLTWQFAFSMPFAHMVAVATGLGMVFTSDPERRPLPFSRETWLLLALWAIYTGTTLAAFYPDEAWHQWNKVSKILLFTFLPMMYLQTRQRLRWMFLVLALSLGFYGLKGGIFALRTGGVYNVMGPAGTFIGGNTDIGLALNMTLPFLLFLGREETRPWLRRLLLVIFAFSVVAIIFTYSRGAVIGLAAVLLMLFARAKHRLLAVVAVVVLALFVQYFSPEQWFTRMETISTYEEDRSARMRLESWQVAWRLALEHPFTGGGFLALPHDEIFRYYIGPRYIRAQTAHSIYFTVLGDHGFLGFSVFVALIVSCFASLLGLRWRLRHLPEAAWLVRYAQMVEASLVAYVVSGAFLTQAYFDLFYALVSFVILLKAIARNAGFAPVPVADVDPRALSSAVPAAIR